MVARGSGEFDVAVSGWRHVCSRPFVLFHPWLRVGYSGNLWDPVGESKHKMQKMLHSRHEWLWIKL